MASKDYYAILGLNKNASEEDIKKAYRNMALKYHPDRLVNASEAEKKTAENKLKEITEAYSVLKDPKKRQQYDNFGSDYMNQGGGFSDFNVNDIFNQFFGEGANVFDDFFGNFGSSKSKNSTSQKGEDLKITIKATLDDIALGVKKKIKITHYIACNYCNGVGSLDPNSVRICRNCNGTGYATKMVKTVFGSISVSRSVCPECGGSGSINVSPCSHCHGEGREKSDDTIEISIPAGIDENMQFIVKGAGNFRKGCKNSGDLYVQVLQVENDNFKRKDCDIYSQIQISFLEAVFGSEKIIDTLYGKLKVKIDAGIQNGTCLKLKNKGLKNINGYGYGDQYVYVNIYIPTNLNKNELSILKQLENSDNFIPKGKPKMDKSFFSKLKNWF